MSKKKEKEEDTRMPEFIKFLNKKFKEYKEKAKTEQNWKKFQEEVFKFVKKRRYTWEQAGQIFEEVKKKKKEWFK